MCPYIAMPDKLLINISKLFSLGNEGCTEDKYDTKGKVLEKPLISLISTPHIVTFGNNEIEKCSLISVIRLYIWVSSSAMDRVHTAFFSLLDLSSSRFAIWENKSFVNLFFFDNKMFNLQI